MHKNIKDLSGKTFGEWTVVDFGGSKNGKAYWKCRCSCGKESIIKGTLLINGGTKSCIHKSWNKKEIAWEEDENGCWICTSHTVNKYGYPRFRYKGKMKLVHRYMYERKYGEAPEDLLVCHKCDNRVCINLDHLFLGTNQDNMTDMCLKNRQNKIKGEKHYKSKLTEEQVREIRFSSKGIYQDDLAKKYNVSQSVIGYIINNKIWKHVQ